MLSQSARNIPHVGGVNQFDVTRLINYAKESSEEIQKNRADTPEKIRFKVAIRKNYSAFFLKVIAHSLYHAPTMNSFLDYRKWRSGGTLYLAEDINISYTINTKFGVIKPIIRNPHLKSIETVANEMRDLTRRARKTDANELYKRVAMEYIKTSLKQFNLKEISGMWMLLRALLWKPVKVEPSLKNIPEDQKLQVTDLLGATCTLASIGMETLGYQTVTAITPPELFMLGLGDLRLAPGVVDGQVVPRHMITVFATFDHRAFDAGALFPFLVQLKRYIDNPEKIYEWKQGDEI
jgi:pyruvate/2-oxoglutarate dehydrogenase complex dihydrolipoamide acyltransferase (E2) component